MTVAASKIRFVTSKEHSLRLSTASEWLTERPALEEIWLLSDRRRSGDELIRRLALHSPGRLGVRSMTSVQLAADFALRGRGRVPLSPLGSEAVAARALDRVLEDHGPLEFFEPVREFPGFLPALVGTLADLRLARVEVAELETIGSRGRDLARLLERFERELESQRLGDRAALFEDGIQTCVSEQGSHRPVAMLWLDLQVTSSLEAAWLGALEQQAAEILLLAPETDIETLGFLSRELGVEPQALDSTPKSSGAGLSRLASGRQFLFGSDLEASAPADGISEPNRPVDEVVDSQSLVFFSAPGEGQEAVEIARRIHQLARDGVAFDRIAILLRNPVAYQPLVEAALDRAKIPAYYSRGVLRPDPSGRALLALIDCVSEGLSAFRFAEYLSFGQVPNVTSSGEPPARSVPWVPIDTDQDSPSKVQLSLFDLLDPEDSSPPTVGARGDSVVAGTLAAPSQWEQLLVEAAVVEGEDRWSRRLGGLQAELRRQLADPEEGEDAKGAIERSLSRLENLERFALPLIAELSAWPDSGTWEEWLRLLEGLAVKSLRRPQRALQVLAELRPMAEVAGVPRSEVRRVLADRLTNMRGGSEGRCYGKVFVAPIEEARGRSFDSLFLPGMAEGVFPRPHFEDPLLLDADRRKLGRGLAIRRTLGDRERLLAGLALGAAEVRLVASYPTLDAIQERARVPSFYALDLLRAADGALPDQKTLERESAANSALRQGWPAPRDPRVAIDPAEFDLAVIEPLLRELESAADPRSMKGRASYLVAVSDRLARSLRLRGRRWRNFFSYADGLVDPGAELGEALESRRPVVRAYSPTALQSWAACPYRFYLRGLMGLRPRDEVVRLERLDPRTRGSLFHEVQAETLRRLRESAELPVTEGNLEKALAVLDQQLDKVVLRSEEELVPALPGVWRSEIEALRVDLRGWLRDVASAEEPWIPAYFELGFGLPARKDRDASSVREPVKILERFLVRGAIDMVEVSSTEERLRVTDHKTGRAPKATEVTVGGGEVLQPLVYAFAAQEMLGIPVERGRLYFSSRRGGFQSREVPVSPYHEQYLLGVLDGVDGAVASGFLPAVPRDGACKFCDYRPVCGPYEETRASRKQRERLASLDKVRSFP